MPIDLISLPIGWAVKKILDIPADKIVKRLVSELNPQIKRVQEKIDLVQLGLERSRIAELRAGLSFLEFDKPEQAFGALVRADAHNEFSPVAKILLARLLFERGRTDDGWKKLGEAAELNPYLVIPLVDHDRGVTGAMGEEYGNAWTLRLWDQAFVRHLAEGWPRKLLQRLFGFYSARSTAAISSASLCGNGLAVQWILGDNLKHKNEEVLMAVNTKDGTVLWRHRNVGWTLVFACYRYVVAFDNENYFFVDWKNGQKDRTSQMSPEYFSAMYLGGGGLQALPAFDKSNWTGTPASQAYEKSAVFLEPRIECTDTTLGHLPKPWIEGTTLRDPFGFKVPEVKVQNKWDHFHFPGGTGGMLPSCRLIGGGRIDRGSLTDSCTEPESVTITSRRPEKIRNENGVE